MNSGIVETSLRSLGKGFDLTSDFRLKYCKGRERLVLLNEAEGKDLVVPGFGVYKDVSIDIKCDKGDRTRYQSDILQFNKMSEFFNQKSSIPGKIPSGLFNAMFGFEPETWADDEANTKYLGLDGNFIILFDVHIDRFPLVLSQEVINAVPSSWDPRALARFIEKYGTHVIVGLGIGGQDVILVRQDNNSTVGPSELKHHLDNLGDQLFTGTCNFSPSSRENKYKAPPQAFNLFCDTQPIGCNNFASIATKDGISVKCVKRGGTPSIADHLEWLPTVQKSPDAIHFSFIPTTSLLMGVPGKGFLSHAINLYLRYKPPISELHYFLDFQFHKAWAPIHNDLPLGPTNISGSSPALQFNLLGPKLFVNTTTVISGNRPVTGMRLFLEGMKCNRLAVHLQHLSNTPSMLENKIDITQLWRGSEDISEPGYVEPVSKRKFSHVCTAPVEFHFRKKATEDEANIVTGAQLHIKKQDSKTVLHLRLSFSRVSDCNIVQSSWDECYSEVSQKSASLFSTISTSLSGGSPSREKPKQLVVVDSSVFPSGPPVPVQTQRLLKFVDTSQVCRGPQDTPGHWVVTGARLHLENGKICLLVKFSLLNICST